MLQLGFLKILHGTELEQRVEEYGFRFSKEPPYEVYATPWLSQADMKNLKLAAIAVDRLHNSGRFRRTLALCVPLFARAFDFFLEAGRVIYNEKSLDDLTDCLYMFLCRQFPDRKEEIRDAMVCDRLATNSSKMLPRSLYRADPSILSVRKRLNESPDTAEKPHVRRSITLLYHSKKAVYADYIAKNHRGEYPLGFLAMEENANE